MIRARLDAGGAIARRPGDAILVNGLLGDHGAAILNARGDMALRRRSRATARRCIGLIEALLAAVPTTRFMRDATRGGIATVLNEIADASGVGIEIDRDRDRRCARRSRAFARSSGSTRCTSPMRARSSPSFPPDQQTAAFAAMRGHPLGRQAAPIGRVSDQFPGRVVMKTVFGGHRIVDMLVGDQLPRIC